MPRVCTVCTHEKRVEIDEALVRGEPYRAIARQYGLSKDAVGRHAENHLPEVLKKAHAIKETAWADALLERVEALITQAEKLLLYGESERKGSEWASGLRELRKSLELLGRVSGALDERPQVNLIALPEWVELRTVILQTLVPYPDAKKALAEVLNGDSH